jgi:hypothetical protein
VSHCAGWACIVAQLIDVGIRQSDMLVRVARSISAPAAPGEQSIPVFKSSVPVHESEDTRVAS